MQIWISRFYHNVVTVQLFFLLFFSLAVCQLRTRAPPGGHVQDQTAQSDHTGVLHRQYHSHRYRTPPYLHRNRQTDRRSVALLCMLPEGSCSQRIEVKLQSAGNSFVTKHSFVNLVPEGMLSLQAVCNLSWDVFLRNAAENARLWF